MMFVYYLQNSFVVFGGTGEIANLILQGVLRIGFRSSKYAALFINQILLIFRERLVSYRELRLFSDGAG